MKINYIKNKKGDIAITLILILTFVLVIIGLYAFATDDARFGPESYQISSVFNTLNFNENYAKSEKNYIKTLTEMILNGRTVRFEYHAKFLNKFFEIALFSPGENLVFGIFYDISL